MSPRTRSTSRRNFYPRPPRGGRPPPTTGSLPLRRISIHALREEGDAAVRCRFAGGRRISIHALREEGDEVGVCNLVDCLQFLSTPSARRATDALPALGYCLSISIHALREEGDRLIYNVEDVFSVFLSTPSARRATVGMGTFCAPSSFLSTPSARRATA